MGTLENIIEKGPDTAGTWLHNQFTGAPAAPEAHDAASDKWSSSVANEVDIQASAATISAGSVSLGGNISLPGLPTGDRGSSPLGSGGRSTTSSGIAAAGSDSGSMASLYSGSSILGRVSRVVVCCLVIHQARTT